MDNTLHFDQKYAEIEKEVLKVGRPRKEEVKPKLPESKFAWDEPSFYI